MIDILYSKLIDRFYDKKSTIKRVYHCCILCGKENQQKLLNRCPDCGGAMDAIYNLSAVNIKHSIGPLERYFDLLPIENLQHLLWMGEGNTPCFHAKKIGELTNLKHLYLKNETHNPTRSTKDRIASVGLSRFNELGINKFVIASTGNSSTAFGRAVQMTKNFSVDIFVAKDFLHRLNYADHSNVNTYVCSSDFVGADICGIAHAKKNNIYFEGGFFSLARREGLKCAYLEAFDQMPQKPKYVFQAISSGMGLLGAFKGAIEYQKLGFLKEIPAFFGVQQETCSPMAAAFNEKSSTIQSHHIVKNPKGIAEAILRGDPSQSYPYIYSICSTTGGRIIEVSNEEIYSAHRNLLLLEGLQCCYASASALAGAIKMRQLGIIPAEEPVLVNITGSNRPFSPVPKNIFYVE